MLCRGAELCLDGIMLRTLAKSSAFQGGTFKRAAQDSASGSLERAPEAPDLVFRRPTPNADAISSFGSVERGLRSFGSHLFTMEAQAAETASAMLKVNLHYDMHIARGKPIM